MQRAAAKSSAPLHRHVIVVMPAGIHAVVEVHERRCSSGNVLERGIQVLEQESRVPVDPNHHLQCGSGREIQSLDVRRH